MHGLRMSVVRVGLGAGVVMALCVLLFAAMVRAESPTAEIDTGERLVTIYDQGEKRVVLTKTDTIQATLEQANISIAEHDRIEPSVDTRYIAKNYTVNIYRAHPVMIVEGMKRQQVLTPYRSALDIVKDAGIAVRSEDKLELSRPTDMLADGIGMQLEITRATPVHLALYGAESVVYTQATTVRDLLAEKGISLSDDDTLSVELNAAITPGLKVEIWRDGAQTVTIEEEIDFGVRHILDADLPMGERKVKTQGVKGKKQVSYEVVMTQGSEVSRVVIRSVTTQEPQEQIEVIGNKPTNPLTPSKGAHIFIDSKGVSHRETYYDLPMNIVMGACGGGGYTVRADGAKVDKDGYILIAAHLGNYPRCSIVETSMGLGKVYDTGGFVAKHPHGFDLATDWTKRDGI